MERYSSVHPAVTVIREASGLYGPFCRKVIKFDSEFTVISYELGILLLQKKYDVMSNCGPGRKEVVHTRDNKIKGYIVKITNINSISCVEWEKPTITLFEWRNASVQIAERECFARACFGMHCASCNCVRTISFDLSLIVTDYLFTDYIETAGRSTIW